MDVTYTYDYHFYLSFVAMTEEVISEKTKEVSIAVSKQDFVPIKMKHVPKTMK